MSKEQDIRFAPKRSAQIKPLKIRIINKGYIPLLDQSYNILSGEGGVGKSQIAIKSMVVYLLDNPNNQALMFMTEDGIGECMSRLKSICAGMNRDHKWIDDRVFWVTLEDAPVEKLVKRQDGFKSKNQEFIDRFVEFSIFNSIGFVCLDPLRAFHDLEENSNDEMPILTRELLPILASKVRACFIVLHHSAKGAGSQVRGASSIANDSRLVWNVSKAVEKNNMTGKTEAKEGFENKVKLSIYKDNFGAARYCTIRDGDGMIELPIVKKINTGGHKNDMPVI